MRGDGAWLWDRDGRRYLDATGGALVVTAGHGVGKIIDAVAAQIKRLDHVHGTEFTSPSVEELGRQPAARVPVDDARLYLGSASSEASETAIKLARQDQLARGEAGRYTVVHQENLEAPSSPMTRLAWRKVDACSVSRNYSFSASMILTMSR